MKRNKWIPVEAIKITNSGKVQVKTRNPRNVQAGAYGPDGIFHPFRSSSDYDPDRAGDDYESRSDNRGAGKYTKRKTKPKAKRKRAKR